MEPMNYTLGRGELYFNKFKPGTMTGIGERYFGNTPEINMTNEVETLDHYNSDRGIREKDASVILQTSRSGSFTTDHISPENLALFFFGNTEALTQTAETGESETIADVQPGFFYQLGVSGQNPTGVRNVKNVTVSVSGSSKTAGTDFLVNADLGRIEILEGGTIAKGDTITVGYDTEASSRILVVSGSTSIEGSLRYIAQNPKGDQIDYFWPWVRINPNGDFALKGDEWQVIPFSFEALRRPGYEAVYLTTRGVTSS